MPHERKILKSLAFWSYLLSFINGIAFFITSLGSYMLFVAMGAYASFYLYFCIFLALFLMILAIPSLFFTRISAIAQLIVLLVFIPFGLLLASSVMTYAQNGSFLDGQAWLSLLIFLSYVAQIFIAIWVNVSNRYEWTRLDRSLPPVFRNFLVLLPPVLVFVLIYGHHFDIA